MNLLLIQLVSLTVNLIIWIVILNIILSFFMSPYHPIRETLERIVGPMLNPIRQIMPQTGMLDFSPMVLLFIVQIVGNLIITTLQSF